MVEVLAVAVMAVAAVRGKPAFPAAAPSVALALEPVGFEVPWALSGTDGFVVDPRRVPAVGAVGSACEVAADVGAEEDAAGPVAALSLLPESAPVAAGPVACTRYLVPDELLRFCPEASCPLAPVSLLSVAPLGDADDFDPALVPSSAAATPIPLTRAAPMPKATALVPSHLQGSRIGRAACCAR